MGNSGCFPRGKPAVIGSCYPTYNACWVFGYFSVSIIHQTLTWTTGPLTCARMKMHPIVRGGVRTLKESVMKADWEKNPLQHWGIEPASVVCRSDFLPTELHPHPPFKPFEHSDSGLNAVMDKVYCMYVYLVRCFENIELLENSSYRVNTVKNKKYCALPCWVL